MYTPTPLGGLGMEVGILFVRTEGYGSMVKAGKDWGYDQLDVNVAYRRYNLSERTLNSNI